MCLSLSVTSVVPVLVFFEYLIIAPVWAFRKNLGNGRKPFKPRRWQGSIEPNPDPEKGGFEVLSMFFARPT